MGQDILAESDEHDGGGYVEFGVLRSVRVDGTRLIRVADLHAYVDALGVAV
jgi:hypothetical protein